MVGYKDLARNTLMAMALAGALPLVAQPVTASKPALSGNGAVSVKVETTPVPLIRDASIGKPTAGSLPPGKPAAGSLTAGPPRAGSLTSEPPRAGSMSSVYTATSVTQPPPGGYVDKLSLPRRTLRDRLNESDDASSQTGTGTRSGRRSGR